MNKSDNIADLLAAVVAFQGEMPTIPKTKENPFFKGSKYAPLPEIQQAMQPVMLKHGLAVMQLPQHDDAGHDTLLTVIVHMSGQWISAEMLLHMAKSDAQGQGSAISYARRYALSAALGISADDDDDGNAATFHEQSSRKRRPPASSTSTAAATGGRGTEVSARDRNRIVGFLAKGKPPILGDAVVPHLNALLPQRTEPLAVITDLQAEEAEFILGLLGEGEQERLV